MIDKLYYVLAVVIAVAFALTVIFTWDDTDESREEVVSSFVSDMNEKIPMVLAEGVVMTATKPGLDGAVITITIVEAHAAKAELFASTMHGKMQEGYCSSSSLETLRDHEVGINYEYYVDGRKAPIKNSVNSKGCQ